ncbi:MAG TPA: polymer-forming cytoskeletal protein [Candidatus Xenobia bacterium]|nr:polymer-forming cytoskeletal protein [Candidatus Xenobia bacterium]
MKWMGSGKAPSGAEDWIGFLDKGVRLEGTLELAGTFRIDGEVRGTVRSKERLIIGEGGRVEGEVIASVVSVSGKVHGKVNGLTRVEILPTGSVEGEVHTPCLVIEAGGVIEGRCHMRAEAKPQRAPQPMPIPAHSS